jgi:hypothetical protein
MPIPQHGGETAMAKIEVKKFQATEPSGLGVIQFSSSYKFISKAEENQN